MIAGKKLYFLGSSVTYGSAAKGISFADLLAEKYGAVIYKEAVSGTTLADINENSYIRRLIANSDNFVPDVFICQLSTNDAVLKIPLGEAAVSFDKNDFDVLTVAGAIEYIIAYAREKWRCPVVFYTGTRFDSVQYEKMVALLFRIQQKWDIGVLDLWNDRMNEIGQKQYKEYMSDPIHPTLKGYSEWWLPKFAEYLNSIE